MVLSFINSIWKQNFSSDYWSQAKSNLTYKVCSWTQQSPLQKSMLFGESIKIQYLIHSLILDKGELYTEVSKQRGAPSHRVSSVDHDISSSDVYSKHMSIQGLKWQSGVILVCKWRGKFSKRKMARLRLEQEDKG